MSPGSGSKSYTGAVSLLVLAVAFTGLFLGVENWWVAFVVGYGAVVPLVAMLTGGESESAGGDVNEGCVGGGVGESVSASGSKADALETLRDRYARGELSEAQFEAKLERLLETETLEGARESVGRAGGTSASDVGERGGAEGWSSERDTELERN